MRSLAILRSEFGFSISLELIILLMSESEVRTLPVLEKIFSITSDAIDIDFSLSVITSSLFSIKFLSSFFKSCIPLGSILGISSDL